MLDKAWGLEANSRLSCQARVAGTDLTVEIPKYTINHARDGAHADSGIADFISSVALARLSL